MQLSHPKHKINKRYWKKISEAYLTPYEERTDKQKKITKSGLCRAVNQVIPFIKEENTFGTYELRNKQQQRTYNEYFKVLTNIRLSFTEEQEKECFKLNGYWFSLVEEELRGLLACFIATMPKEIYERFIK